MLVSGVSLFAQTPAADYQKQPIAPHDFNKDNWQQYRKEITYGETSSQQKSSDNDLEGEINETEGGQGAPGEEGGLNDRNSPQTIERKIAQPSTFEIVAAPFFKFLLIVGGILLLVFLIMKLMNAENLFSQKNKKISQAKNHINLDNIEENLHESDLEGFIKQALSDKNYALAIRLYYLAILKELSLSGQIKWKKDKTNQEYLREMNGQNLKPNFQETTLIFERVWYGTGALTESIFQEIEPKFKAVLQAATATNINQPNTAST